MYQSNRENVDLVVIPDSSFQTMGPQANRAPETTRGSKDDYGAPQITRGPHMYDPGPSDKKGPLK